MALPRDTFDEYNSTGDLNGNNGGSGWGGAWSGNTAFDLQSSVVQSGARAVSIASSGTDSFIGRTFASGISSGTWVSYGRMSTATGYGDHGVGDGSTNNAGIRCTTRFDSDGNIKLFYSAFSTSTIQAYSANTWYKIEIEFDCATDDYAVRIDGGSWTARFAFVNSGSTTLDRVIMHKTDSTGGTWYFDTLQDGAFTPALPNTTNLEGYWKMDEASGATREDSSTNNRDAANNGTVTGVTGKIDNGASAWSESNYLSVSDNAAFECDGAFSIAMWYKTGSSFTGNSSVLMSKVNAGATTGWTLYLQANGSPLVFQTNAANNHIATTSFSTSTWYHLVVTRASGGNITFYVNGTVDTAAAAYTAATANTQDMWFARRADSARPLESTAILDEVAFYTKVLTEAEIAALYNGGSGQSISVSTNYTETYTETMPLVDTVNKSTTRTLTDVMTLVDTFLGIKVFERTLTEALVLVDTVERALIRTLTDAATLVDTIPRSIERALTDVMTLVDVLTGISIRARELTESLSLTDNFLVNGTNVIWGKITKSAAAVWTKINRN